MIAAKRKLVLQVVVGTAVVMIAALAAGIGIGYLSDPDSPMASNVAVLWIIGVVALVAMGGAVVVGALWMRSIDEAAREAHKSAWYWGGSSGMAVGGVVVILSSLPQAATVSLPSVLPGRADPAAYAATGAFAMLLLMVTGYGIVWAWWWLARSRG